MKTKLSKRALSVLLAVMMVVTSIPFAAFTSFAANFDSTAIDSAMQGFESKLDQTRSNGKVWKNMGAAYTAYVNCQKAIDLAKYGDDTSKLNTAAQALNAEVNKMDEFNPQFNANAYHTYSLATGGFSNVVYAPYDGTTEYSVYGDGVDAGVTIKFYVPENIVVAYDGTNPVAIPAVIETKCTGKFGVSNQALKSVYSSNGTMYFDTSWTGYMDGKSPNKRQDWPKDRISTEQSLDAQGGTSSSVDATNSSTSRFWWNRLVYHGSGNTTQYYEKITNVSLSAIYYARWGLKNHDNQTFGATMTPEHNIYVINYKAVKSLLDGYVQALQGTAFSGSKTIRNYKEGGLQAVMTAMGNLATDACNPMSSLYSYSSGIETAVGACADAIKTAVENNTGAQLGSADGNGYKALREALNTATPTYNGGQLSWSDETWPDFEGYYPTAKAIFQNIYTTGYNDDTNAGTVAGKLMGYYDALEMAEDKPVVNTEALEIAIENAMIVLANKERFTTASFNAANLTNLVRNAKNEVWQGEANYPNAASKIEDNTANQTKVQNHYTTIVTAIGTLKPNLDDKVAAAGGNSLNDLFAITDGLNASDFTNYDTINEELTRAIAFRDNPDPIDGSVPNALQIGMDLYEEICEELYAAINALQYSFLAIPDGTIAQIPESDAFTMSHSHTNGDQSVAFGYTPSSIVFVKSHSSDTRALTYGNATVIFGASNENASRVNNLIDSITINATAASKGEFNKGNNDHPVALDDADKNEGGQYAGCLSNEGFSLDNFKILQRLTNNHQYIALDKNGQEVRDYNSPLLTEIIGKTEGTGDKPCPGGIFANATKNTTGYVILGADLKVDYAPNPAPNKLTADTTPTVTSPSYSGKYFGAVTVWNVQSGAITYQGYSFFKSDRTIETTANIVDISNLVDLVNRCEAKAADYERYTTGSYETFDTALKNAKKDLDYNTLTVANIRQQLVQRYTDLFEAEEGLREKTFDVTFNYKSNTGADTSETVTVTYGETLGAYRSAVEDITPPPYDSPDHSKTYTFSAWSPSVDYTTPIKANGISYTATYTEKSNKAVWNEYNDAQDDIDDALDDYLYTSASLKAVKAALENGNLSFYNYTDAQKDATMSTSQDAINDETNELKRIKGLLVAVDYDDTLDVAKAVKDKFTEANRTDPDMYAQDVNFEYMETVVINGTPFVGYTYATEKSLTNAIKDVIESMQVKEYSVYLNGSDTPIGTYPYGTAVTVNSPTGNSVAWDYSYSAPSRNNVPTSPKYMTTDTSFTFTIVGNTYLNTTESTQAAAPVVTVIANLEGTGRVVKVITATDGAIELPKLSYAYYTAVGYYDADYSLLKDADRNPLEAGDVISVTEDTTIYVEFEADRTNSYQIDFYDSLFREGYWGDDVLSISDTFAYNEKVTLTSQYDDVYCYAVMRENSSDGSLDFEILSYDTEYSFHVCRSYDFANDSEALIALTEDEYEAIIEDEGEIDSLMMHDGNGVAITEPAPSVTVLENIVPIYDENGDLIKFSMIGTYSLPENYTLLECGMLFTPNGDADAAMMTLDNAEKYGINRWKSSKQTCGNQFVINNTKITNNNYVFTAYAIVKCGEEVTTIYSKMVNCVNEYK